ncbi:hypothetical protein BS50DRAFT_337209 [Corynespora cassiicola Philippines]|uniref:Uncharacterized protein n=1 Tax=Corynespora cassiicola Philippines TaxID=1448308 RepID=A0A2T2NUZ9_CORCC|nr:hypothetical protein BS50DRAFT_337209 [Corynespora cassiicola Philippines]
MARNQAEMSPDQRGLELSGAHNRRFQRLANKQRPSCDDRPEHSQPQQQQQQQQQQRVGIIPPFPPQQDPFFLSRPTGGRAGGANTSIDRGSGMACGAGDWTFRILQAWEQREMKQAIVSVGIGASRTASKGTCVSAQKCKKGQKPQMMGWPTSGREMSVLIARGSASRKLGPGCQLPSALAPTRLAAFRLTPVKDGRGRGGSVCAVGRPSYHRALCLFV